MKNFRAHGIAPYRVAILHGGPGAPGEVSPVARALARTRGVLEPFQTHDTIDGQVQELRDVLEQRGTPPIILIGWSWGAWLGMILAARYPWLVEKLLLVSSGPFDAAYVEEMNRTRLSRLTEDEKREWVAIQAALSGPDTPGRDSLFGRFGALFEKTDSFDPVAHSMALDGPEAALEEIDGDVVRNQVGIYQSVWPKAAELRRSGKLLAYAEKVKCPVVAIHGDYDPHPAEGVRAPLVAVISDFTFILLANCGHSPWIERQASEEFYSVLRRELQAP
jgi:pimeloyl-ACP methyl ester carboxylesterase